MYQIIKQGNHEHYGIIKLVADNQSDVSKAPVNFTPGSKMFCIATSVTYILSPQHEWVEYETGSGGGGGSPTRYDYYGDDKF